MSETAERGAAQVEIVEAPAASSAHSPADVLRLVVAAVVLLVTLLVQVLFGDELVRFTSDLLRGLDALPDWMVQTIVIGTRVLAVLVLIGGLIVTALRGRWRVLASAGLAALAAVVLTVVLGAGDEPTAPPAVTFEPAVEPLDSKAFPSAVGVAIIAAVVTAVAPWISRRWRRAGWALVVGVMITRFLRSPTSFESLRALIIGWFCGALAVVLLGAPSRRPTGSAMAQGLAAVGVPLTRLEQASLDARGSTPYFAQAVDGRSLFTKVLGEDERSADLLFRVYRAVQPWNLGDERPFSSLRRAVEHEALVALAARDVGTRTPRVVAFATAEPNGYVLAYEAVKGRSLDRLEPAEVTDDVLDAIWAQVVLLREHRIAHRDLRLANVFLADDGAVWMIDFGFSELAASDLLLATDVAELVASSSLQVGPERAVARALAAVGPAGLAAADARLRAWSLSGATRAALKAQAGALDDLRHQVQAAAGPAAPA